MDQAKSLEFSKENGSFILSQSGLLVLDAHRTQLDILLTAQNMRKAFPDAEIMMPLAAYILYVPFMGAIAKAWAKYHKINLKPVFRIDEINPRTFWMKQFCKFYPKSLTSDMKAQKNREYLSQALELVKRKNTILIVSPYGGTYKFGSDQIKSGVLKLLEACSFYCLSLTKSSKTIFSQILEKSTAQSYSDLFAKEFNILRQF